MDLFVVAKRPHQAAGVLPAPERIDLTFPMPLATGFIETYPSKTIVSEILSTLTLIANWEGGLQKLPLNVQFWPGHRTVHELLVACLTNEDGDVHGLCEDHTRAVARALDGSSTRAKVGVT